MISVDINIPHTNTLLITPGSEITFQEKGGGRYDPGSETALQERINFFFQKHREKEKKKIENPPPTGYIPECIWEQSRTMGH